MKPLISRESEARYSTGLREFLKYRQLDLAEATGGVVGGRIIKAAGKMSDYRGTGKHRHDLGLQFVYVVRGWVEFEFDSGIERLERGDFMIIPPNLPHEQVGYADNVELFEVTAPAEFPTVDVP